MSKRAEEVCWSYGDMDPAGPEAAKSLFAPGRQRLTASKHSALWKISDWQHQSLKMMNSSESVEHRPGERDFWKAQLGNHTYLSSVAANLNDSGNRTQNSKLQVDELWGFKIFFAL